jgi:hypothetical protein
MEVWQYSRFVAAVSRLAAGLTDNHVEYANVRDAPCTAWRHPTTPSGHLVHRPKPPSRISIVIERHLAQLDSVENANLLPEFHSLIVAFLFIRTQIGLTYYPHRRTLTGKIRCREKRQRESSERAANPVKTRIRMSRPRLLNYRARGLPN